MVRSARVRCEQSLASGVFTTPTPNAPLYGGDDAMANRFFTLLVMVGALALADARAGGAVARFDTAEIVLRSASSFNASQGTPNPFTAVDLTARVTAPSGRVYTVPGFFDGDGASGT